MNVVMNQVRCHHCGKTIALEDARPRGKIYKGFVCPACFRRQARTAWTIVFVIVVVFTAIKFLGNPNESASHPDFSHSNMTALFNASYEQAGVRTNVREIPSPAHVGSWQEFELGWGKHLLIPLDKSKLIGAGFGYTGDLLTPGSRGGILEETPTSRKVGVIGGAYRFEVTQVRVP